MKSSQICALSLSTGALLALHGCGGGGGDSGGGGGGNNNDVPIAPHMVTTAQPITSTPVSTTSATAATTIATTTTTTGPRTPPLSGDEAAAYFNSLYTGYAEGDENSPVGVVMRTADSWGFFCDGFADATGCFNGFAECITSASILNNQVMMNNGDQLFMGLRRTTGIMFNTSLVETKMGRCTYQYDGTSWGRYNRGCGSTAPNGEGFCEDKTSAWWNKDPKTGEECTDKSDVVLKDYCPKRKSAGTAPMRSGDSPCFWKGPAFYPQGGFIKSETHDMMSQRIANQKDYGDQVSTWDEVVLDAAILLEELRRDPAAVVSAMVYDDSGDVSKTGEAKKTAMRMAKKMQAEFNMNSPVPVVGVDTQLHVHAQPDIPGPFFYGEKMTTQTTTTTPRTGPACCFNSCDGTCANSADFCGQSTGNCATCSGIWCTAEVLTNTIV